MIAVSHDQPQKSKQIERLGGLMPDKHRFTAMSNKVTLKRRQASLPDSYRGI